MPFKPGQSGNPGGKPRELASIQALARKHDRAAVEKLAHLMEHAESQKDQASCAIALLDRGHGRPAQFSTGDENRLRSALEYTDAELIDLAERLSQRSSETEEDAG